MDISRGIVIARKVVFGLLAVGLLWGGWLAFGKKEEGSEDVLSRIPAHKIEHVDVVAGRYYFTLDDSSQVVSGPQPLIADEITVSGSSAIKIADYKDGYRNFYFLNSDGQLVCQITSMGDELRFIPHR